LLSYKQVEQGDQFFFHLPKEKPSPEG